MRKTKIQEKSSTITGTAAVVSVQRLINSSMFTLIMLFAEMIKLTVDLQLKPNKSHCK